MWPDPKGPNNIYGNIGSGIEMKPVLEFTFTIYCNTGPVNSRKPVLSSAVLLTSNVYFLVCALPCTHYIEGWRKFFSCPLDISIQSRWDCRTWKFEMGPPVTGILELDSAGLFLCETSPGGYSPILSDRMCRPNGWVFSIHLPRNGSVSKTFCTPFS